MQWVLSTWLGFCIGHTAADYPVQAGDQAAGRSQHLIAPQQVEPSPVPTVAQALQLSAGFLVQQSPVLPAAKQWKLMRPSTPWRLMSLSCQHGQYE